MKSIAILAACLLALPCARGAEQAGPLTPEQSARSFTTFDDLQVEQVLAEPIVRQPVHLSWDARGRLWVVQYLQYPAPAGLTIQSKDQFWRAVYDKVPPPPPHHFKGADKVTIHEDTDGDGRFDRHSTFLEGLNIVTAIEHAPDGVWVLNPPYLLFFPDKNHDDVVDDNPVVHLAGFGLEDTHSVANSLRWGPDGWLYGAHGSTVTANVVRPGLDENPIARIMGQAIWRYHPATRRFEVFAEGGGNAFGLEIDDQGRIFSGHNGGNTRGFHYVQGGYLQKGFEKHGPLSNPFAFGYFKQMAGTDAERFTHTFVIYGGGALPERYAGNLFGAEPLQGRIVFSQLQREGSSFKTRDEGYAVTSTDRFFKPVDIKVGPDGAIYIADWYDRQVTHTRNYEGSIDKSNGRIYRLSRKGSAPALESTPRDPFGSLTSANRTVRQIAWRAPAKASPPELKKASLTTTGQPALEFFWAYNRAAGLDDASAQQFLEHPDPFVRLWAIRILGDSGHFTEAVQNKVLALARHEPHVEVRSQLASTARRLPATQALPLLHVLLSRSEDASDIYIPLLLWWALEAKAESDRDAVVALLSHRELWELPLVRGTILDRIMKRYALAGTQADLRTCARLLQLAPNRDAARQLLNSFEQAWAGRAIGVLPAELQQAIQQAGGRSMAMAIRQGDADSVAQGIKVIEDASVPTQQRAELVQVFGQVNSTSALPGLLRLTRDPKLQRDALNALSIYDDPRVAAEIIPQLPYLRAESLLAAFNVLASRLNSAQALVKAVEQGALTPKQVPPEIVEKLRAEEALASKVDEVFGAKPTLDKAAVDAKLRAFTTIIRAGAGSPFEGQKNFQLACAACHKLFGEGGQIGPDLTPFKRDDLETLLMNIVNPSGEIREGYENVALETRDGRSLSGFIAEKYDDAVVLRDLAGQTTLVPKKEILSLKAAGRSLMPEGLLDGFDEQQVRDLFAYLRSTQPLVKQR